MYKRQNISKDDIGKKIDKRARKFLRESNLDYAHGTGHGVGFFLNVHEGPQSINKINKVKIEPGMVLSNEPGYYKQNHFGIRIENLVYVDKEDGKLFFRNLTSSLRFFNFSSTLLSLFLEAKPILKDKGVNLSSALSCLKRVLYSAREVNMRYGSSVPLRIRSSISTPI